jgi:hypothetical protein
MNGGGTVYREWSSSPESGRLRRQDKAQRQSLMSRFRGRPSSRCSANTKRLSLARPSTRVGKHRRDVYFARRRTVAHRSGRHHGAVDVKFHEVFQRPGLPSGRRHMGQRQGADLAGETEIRRRGKRRGVWLRELLSFWEVPRPALRSRTNAAPAKRRETAGPRRRQRQSES